MSVFFFFFSVHLPHNHYLISRFVISSKTKKKKNRMQSSSLKRKHSDDDGQSQTLVVSKIPRTKINYDYAFIMDKEGYSKFFKYLRSVEKIKDLDDATTPLRGIDFVKFTWHGRACIVANVSGYNIDQAVNDMLNNGVSILIHVESAFVAPRDAYATDNINHRTYLNDNIQRNDVVIVNKISGYDMDEVHTDWILDRHVWSWAREKEFIINPKKSNHFKVHFGSAYTISSHITDEIMKSVHLILGRIAVVDFHGAATGRALETYKDSNKKNRTRFFCIKGIMKQYTPDAALTTADAYTPIRHYENAFTTLSKLIEEDAFSGAKFSLQTPADDGEHESSQDSEIEVQELLTEEK